MLERVKAALEPVFVGWAVTPHPALDFSDHMLEMSLQAATTAHFTFGAFEMLEELSVRAAVRTAQGSNGLSVAYLELIDARDDIAVTVMQLLETLQEEGIWIGEGGLPNFDSVLPVDDAIKKMYWSVELKIPLRRRVLCVLT